MTTYVYENGATTHVDGGFLRDANYALVTSGAPGVSLAAYGGVPNDATAGATNDAAFTAALASLPSGGGAIYLQGGRGSWYFNSRWAINQSNVTIYGDGSGSKVVFNAGISASNAVRINTSVLNSSVPRLTDIALRFLNFDFQGGDQSWAAGLTGALVAYCVDNITVDHCKLYRGRDYCVATFGCTNVQVTNNRVDTCYWQGASNPINVSGNANVEGDEMVVSGNIVKHTTTLVASSASASASTATYVTSTAHKVKAGQFIKVTGMTPAAYNGYWVVATAPTTTSFTVSLGSTPTASSVAGVVTLQADRNIYTAATNSYRTTIVGNLSSGASACIDAEVGSPGGFDATMTGNIVDDFANRGLGVSNTSGDVAVYGHRMVIAGNTVRGRDGTTEFGVASSGSLCGIVLTGEVLRASDNVITNVREGIRAGLGSTDIEETNYAIADNTIVLAADANGAGINIAKNTSTQYMKRLKIQGNQIDGGLATTSLHGIEVTGHVLHFDVSDNTVYGMGRNGIYLEASGGVSPSTGRVKGNDCFDNSNASSGTYHGIRADASCDSIRLGPANKCYDTRGGSAKQSYGLRVDSGATNIVSQYDDYTGNLTGEISDATATGITRVDYRDPGGHTWPFVASALTGSTSNTAWSGVGGGANGIVWQRVLLGAGQVSNVIVQITAIDSGTPGTTDKVGVAVCSPTGVGVASKPGTLKAASASTTGTNGTNTISLGATIQVNAGDWVGFWAASASTTVSATTANPASINVYRGLAGFGTVTPWPVASSPSTTAGGTLKLPQITLS